MLAKALEQIFEGFGWTVNGQACVAEIQEQVGSLGLDGDCRVEVTFWEGEKKHKVEYDLTVKYTLDQEEPETWITDVEVHAIFADNKTLWSSGLGSGIPARF